MYLIPYAFVTWLQYAVLQAHWSAPANGVAVFLCPLAISWSVTAALRHIAAIAGII
jgi:hypothetical protein